MTELTDEQLAEIARGNITGYYGVPALLAEVRRQREAIARVEQLAHHHLAQPDSGWAWWAPIAGRAYLAALSGSRDD